MSDTDLSNIGALLQHYFGFNSNTSVRSIVDSATSAITGRGQSPAEQRAAKQAETAKQQRKMMKNSDYGAAVDNRTQYNTHPHIQYNYPYKPAYITNSHHHNRSLQTSHVPANYINRRQCAATSQLLPNTLCSINQYQNRVFCSTFSRDGQRISIASQDQHVRVYNTYDSTIQNSRLSEAREYDDDGSWPTLRDIECRYIGWSIIDTDFSPDGAYSVYSTWSNYVQLVNVAGSHDVHESLDLCPTSNRFCVFSVKFNSNGQQILCGCSDANVYLYDIVTKQRLFCVNAHTEDVNNVCWVDDSSNVFVSGSDDSCIRIWDVRTLSNDNVDTTDPNASRRLHINRHNVPVGSLIGHTDGITYMDSKQDGVYIVSNGKDQCAKLWDIRKSVAGTAQPMMRESNWDYRWSDRGTPRRNTRMGMRRMGTRANPSSSDAEEDVLGEDSDDMEYVLEEEVIEEDEESSDEEVDDDVAYMRYDTETGEIQVMYGDEEHDEEEAEDAAGADAYNTMYTGSEDENTFTHSQEQRTYSDDEHMGGSQVEYVDDEVEDNSANGGRTARGSISAESSDVSVMTYRGHRVLDTLIRIRFSPAHSTAQQYVYTGSQDGDCHIYNALTGKCVQKLSGGHSSTVRDVAWHPWQPQIMTSGWDGVVGMWNYRPSRGGGSGSRRRSSVDSQASADY